MNATTLASFPDAPTPSLRARTVQQLQSWIRRPAKARDPRIDDIQRLRAMAQGLQFAEPGFASDLLAAADRHERELDSSR